MAHAKTARWLDLIAFLLQHRFPVDRDAIYQAVGDYREASERDDETSRESLRRKFERDKDELRAMGIDIETVELKQWAGDEPSVGYRLRPRSFYLPYLELADDRDAKARPIQGLETLRLTRQDLATLDRATRGLADHPQFPLAQAARSVRRKLAFDLPLPLERIERILSRPLPPESESALAVLQRAVLDRTAVRCTYYAIGRDEEELREIEPYGLFFSWGRWYCVAGSRERGGETRLFRVDRLRDAKPIKGAAGRFEPPSDFSVRPYLGRSAWELSSEPPTSVRVRFAFPESRWVMAQGVGTATEPLADDGGAVLDFAVRDRGPFVRWVLTFGGQARVLEPDDVAREVETLKERVAALYHEAGSA